MQYYHNIHGYSLMDLGGILRENFLAVLMLVKCRLEKVNLIADRDRSSYHSGLKGDGYHLTPDVHVQNLCA